MGLSWFLHVKLSGKLSLEIAKLQAMWFGSRKVERRGAVRVGGRAWASRDMGVGKASQWLLYLLFHTRVLT